MKIRIEDLFVKMGENDYCELEDGGFLTSIDALEIAKDLLGIVLDETHYNLETEEDKKKWDTIATAELLLKNVLEKEKK